MLTDKKISARVFNVVHGSFVDGYGIRTTIFLKGCPLRCLWCCNPESQKMEPELQIISEHCTGCGNCLNSCLRHALSLEDRCIRVDRSLCNGCGACVRSCWYGALSVYGEIRSAEELFDECLRDKAFYLTSGGGITLSGGEATLQPEFCLEMIRLAHDEGISVAVDTCGYTETESGLEVLRQADLILFDVKGINAERHRKNTGRSNELIMQNLNRLEEWGKAVIIRYPVIPEHNMQEAEAIAQMLASYSCIRRVDLIPYHDYGTVKYQQLDRVYPLQIPAVSRECQEQLLAHFRLSGLNTQLGG